MSNSFQEGRDAYCDCKELSDNPHVNGTPEYADWKQGFQQAKQNDPLAPDDEIDETDEADGEY